MDIEKIRREYLAGGLRRANLQENPLQQFSVWLQEACDGGLQDPTAMVLATVSSDGQPSQRIVLLKHFDEQGFVFFTNYGSQKANEIAVNNKVSLLFPWHNMERQVKLCGLASKISTGESFKYFSGRPDDSQVAAWASRQSTRISSRQFLMQQFETMKAKFADGKIPLPDFWGGYRVQIQSYEFWQGRSNRLHDRFLYERQLNGDNWKISRLAP